MKQKLRSASNETALVSEIQKIIVAPWQEKKTVSILNDEFCEGKAFPYLLPKDKFN